MSKTLLLLSVLLVFNPFMVVSQEDEDDGNQGPGELQEAETTKSVERTNAEGTSKAAVENTTPNMNKASAGTCDASTWPDLQNGLVCGYCKALIGKMDSKYRSCSNFCKTIGQSCSGAWEESKNSCKVKSIETCTREFTATSDAICQCGPTQGAEEITNSEETTKSAEMSTAATKVGSGENTNAAEGTTKAAEMSTTATIEETITSDGSVDTFNTEGTPKASETSITAIKPEATKSNGTTNATGTSEAAETSTTATNSFSSDIAEEMSKLSANISSDIAEEMSQLNANISSDNAEEMSQLSANISSDIAEKMSQLSANISSDNAEEMSQLRANISSDIAEEMSQLSANISSDNAEEMSQLSTNIASDNAEEMSQLSANISSDNAVEMSQLSANISSDNAEEMSKLSNNISSDNAEEMSQLSANISSDIAEKMSQLSANISSDNAEEMSQLRANISSDIAEEMSQMSANISSDIAEEISQLRQVVLEIKKGQIHNQNPETSTKKSSETKALYFQKEELTLKRANRIATLPKLHKEYLVSVDLKVTSFGTSYQSIIHFTAFDENTNKNGGRIPGIWIYSKKLHFGVSLDGKNQEFSIGNTLPTKKWINIQVSQKLENGKYLFTILVDGQQKKHQVNTKPQEFNNVIVYAANPWHAPANGSIRNFYIIN